MTLCNNNDQTWFYDTLTSAIPSGVVETLASQVRVSTPPSGSNRCKCIENMIEPYIKADSLRVVILVLLFVHCCSHSVCGLCVVYWFWDVALFVLSDFAIVSLRTRERASRLQNFFHAQLIWAWNLSCS